MNVHNLSKEGQQHTPKTYNIKNKITQNMKTDENTKKKRSTKIITLWPKVFEYRHLFDLGHCRDYVGSLLNLRDTKDSDDLDLH